jgi:hypothetical protein
VVHLEAVAATFGQGTSSGTIIHISHTSTSISCVEDGMLVPGGQLQLTTGLADVASALLLWLQQQGLWPQELEQQLQLVHQGYLFRGYGMDVVRLLVLDNCYCPKVRPTLCATISVLFRWPLIFDR